MTFKTSRRQKQSSIRLSFGAVESLESRALLSSISTFLKLASGTVASAADLVNPPALKDGTASLGTYDVTTKTKTLSIVPSTGDLASYRYLWQVSSAPDGGSIVFAKNSSNAAKQNTLSFSMPGSYEISVSIQNSGVTLTSGTLAFNVISSISNIAIKTPAGQLLPANGSTVSGTSTQLSAVAVDQFGTVLETQPSITWQISKQPTGATTQLSTNGSTASLTFNRAGSYSLTSSTGNLKTTVPITVTQSLSTFALTMLDKTLLSSESTLDVTTTSLKLNFSVFDQFRQPMSTLPAISWTTQSPPGKTGSASLNKGVLTVSFSGSGLYTTESTISGQTFRFSSNVVPTLAAITILKSDGTTINTKSPATITGTNLTLTANAFDQFGLALSEQPSITWQTTTAPTSSAAKLTNTQGSLLFEPDTAGRYVLRAQSEAVSTEAVVVVNQTLTSMALVLPDGTTPTTDQPLVVDKTSATLKLNGLDQFGKSMVTLPKINWSSPAVPAAATATVKLTGTAAACTFTRIGDYTVAATFGNVTCSASFRAVPTLTSFAITRDGTAVTGTTPITVTGTSLNLAATARDQFGQNLEGQPSLTWAVIASPTGSTAKLTGNTNSLLFEPDTAGKYNVRVQSGNVYADVSIAVTQTLTSMALVLPDGTTPTADQPLVVDKTSVTLKLNGLDQFEKAMVTLPKISWSSPVVPASATATVKLTGTAAACTFTRIGDYTVAATFGNVTCSASFRAVPTLTSFSITRDGATITGTTPVTVIGTSINLAAAARDQFGQNLESQPSLNWATMTSPTGSAAKLTGDASSVLFEPDTVGKYTVRVQSGNVYADAAIAVTQTLTSMALVLPDGTTPTADQPLIVDKTSATLTLNGLDQFGKTMITLPKITWSSPVVPASATATVKLTGTAAACTFTRIGDFTVSAAFGSVTCSASFRAVPTLTSFAITRDGTAVTGTTPIAVTGTSLSLAATARDQFGQYLEGQPSLTWTATNSPSPGQATIQSTARSAVVSFPRSGSYSISLSSAALVVPVKISVIQTATSVEVTPSSFSLLKAASRQLSARAIDQFGITMATQPTFKWTATGGTVSSKGLYVAGSQTGNFTVTLTAGTLSATSAVEITNPVAPSGLNDPTLNSLVNSFYVDQTIDRNEMIQILRSTGSDGNVNAVEFSDLQFLVSMSTPFSMPSYVRVLASDVVGTNAANLKYQGLTLGNLGVGSVAAQLNRLVDKWFLGTDEPQISTSGLTYQTSVGSLFNGTPSRADTRQGMLGDCYFIAAAAAIADRNPDAIRNMFIDNGDGTYTVRFYSSGASGMSADYVTVNRRLPAYSNGALGYSGYGLNVSQSTTTLWIALAEKAYAQWNETGLSGRDGTNRYAAIEGGWMWYVNAQVLGVNSTYSYFSSTSKDVLVNALTAKQAVTLGTWSNASAGGLYGSHAYIVTGYNASTDTFSLHNPWGVSHPTPLTWTQLQSNCSIFVTTNTSPLSSSIRTTGVSTPSQSLVRPQQRAQSPSSLHTPMTLVVIDGTTDVRLITTSNEAIPTSETSMNKTDTQNDVSQTIQQTNPVETNDLPTDLLDLAFIGFDLNLL